MIEAVMYRNVESQKTCNAHASLGEKTAQKQAHFISRPGLCFQLWQAENQWR